MLELPSPAAVADLAAEIAEDAARASIDLRCDPVPNLLAACSPGVYESLLSNLVRNAVKYMGDAPVRHIAIRVTDEGSIVRTEVTDTGPGIAAEKLPYLFVPYFRAHSGGKEGLGLGLATVKRLAEGHRGEVGVRSEQREGSTFWFVLPRAGTAPESNANGGVAEQLRARH